MLHFMKSMERNYRRLRAAGYLPVGKQVKPLVGFWWGKIFRG